MAELTGKVEYPGLRRMITANGDDPRVSYGRLSGPRNASGFSYPSDAVITVDGHGTYVVALNTGAYIWQGSQAATDATRAFQMDLTTKRWRVFYVPGSARLYACPEQDYAAVAAANDVLRVEYQSQAGLWRRSQFRKRFGCPTRNPIPTVLCPTTNAAIDPASGTYTAPADGSLLASANLQGLVGMAYDATTGNLILSVTSPVGSDQNFKDHVYKVGSDGVMHIIPNVATGTPQASYNGIRDTIFSTIWSPAHFVYTSGHGPFSASISAPRQRSMLCSGGILYTLQELVWGRVGLPVFFGGQGESYNQCAGLIRATDLTTGAITTLAVLVWTSPDSILIADFHESRTSLARDSAGQFYVTFNPQDWWGNGPTFAAGRTITYEGIVQVAPGSPTYVNLLSSVPGKPFTNPFVALPTALPTAWAGGPTVDPTIGATYADGLAKAAGTTGHIWALACDGRDDVLVFGFQLDPALPHTGNIPNAGIPADTSIRSIDAATGQYRTIAGATSLQTSTTPVTTYTGLPAYPGDTAINNDGHASNTPASTWGSPILAPLPGPLNHPLPTQIFPGVPGAPYIFTVDRTTNILYYTDYSLSAIRGIQLDNGNLLCTLIGGPSENTLADHGAGEALGPASGMRGYPLLLAVDESSGTLYWAWATSGTAYPGSIYSNIGIYKAAFY